MGGDDFAWAATLMARRRQEYAAYSPVFWRPAHGVEAHHARFLGAAAAEEGAVAVRTDRGFAIGQVRGGALLVDDFTVEAPDLWPTEGRQLLEECAAAARRHGLALRVVTARRDVPKRTLLQRSGLVAVARWWVKELAPIGPAAAWGPVRVADVDALLVPAPPVYDPGGPVCLLGDLDPELAPAASEEAAALGAVLAVVQRDRSPDEAPAEEPQLAAAGFHNPSAFYESRTP